MQITWYNNKQSGKNEAAFFDSNQTSADWIFERIP